MKERKMLGEKIYQLRKEKNLSQTELGDLVGVSNKAVSKWETDEGNPDISLLPKLAKALGVTTDELLGDVSENENSTEETKETGRVKINNDEKFEYISKKRTKKGLPYIHILFGKKAHTWNQTARGVIAIGYKAKGIIAVGILALGLVSVGAISVGLLSYGFFAFGLFSCGAVATGGIAIGGIAVGVVAIGGIAIGYFSIGGLSIGYYAITGEYGKAIGVHKIIIPTPKDIFYYF